MSAAAALPFAGKDTRAYRLGEFHRLATPAFVINCAALSWKR